MVLKKFKKNINICGVNYKIKMTPVPVMNNSLCHGIIDFNNCEILINSTDNTQVQDITFIHECLHGIIEHGDAQTHYGMNTDQEEKLVDALSRGIYQVVKNKFRKEKKK